MSDAKFFHYKCQYNDKPCLDFQCDGCPVDEDEKRWMEELDRQEEAETKGDEDDK